jgi:hypothetical protein
MLKFDNEYASDQSGVRLVAHEGRRRVLFRIEKRIALKRLETRSGVFPVRANSTESLNHIHTACKRAYLEAPRPDNFTLIQVELRHFENC